MSVVFHFRPAAWLGASGAPATADDLLAAMIRGDPRAVERARTVMNADAGCLLLLAGRALSDASWTARAAGCELLAGRNDPEAVSMLLPRASDSDGRVRMLAIGALSRVHSPPLPLPQKFAPVDTRDGWLLAWMDDYAARTGSRLAEEICEAYAGADHVEFGKPLADRCFTCHVGRSPAAFSASDACASCHQAIHGQWSRTAHAQSLLHLHLATPGPSGAQAVWMDFGEVRGIGCTECHPIAGPRPVTTMPAIAATSSPAQCPYQFVSGEPAEQPCARCHASIQAEWLIWRSRPHPRRPEWPPGQVDLDVEGDERTCIHCHMVRGPDGTGPRDHRWAARRDSNFLRSGVDVQILPPDASNETRLLVTNLTGHAFPTGTRRRAIKLYAGSGIEEDLPLALTLSSDSTEGPGKPGTILAPGEQQIVKVPLPAEARSVAYRMLFVRDHYNPQSYTAPIVSGSCRLPGIGPDLAKPTESKENVLPRQ